MDDLSQDRAFVSAVFRPEAAKAVAGLMSADKSEALHSLLTAHRRNGEDAAFALDHTPLFGRYQEICEALPPLERRLFCIFAEQSFGISFREHDKPKEQRHPFAVTFASETNVTQEEAQDYLIRLYDSGRQKCFAVALSFFVHKFRRPFLEELCQHDRFNRHVAIVDRPSTAERSGYVTPLVLVVSNSAVAPFVERADRPEDGSPWRPGGPDDHFNDGFQIISSDGTFNSLAQATAAALANRGSSRLYGTYGGTSSASMNYESLVLTHAEILRLIKDGSNYFADAVQRAEYQKDQCAGLYHGGMFGQRFIKQAGYPDWARAIWNRWLSGLSDEEIEETAYQLTRHAMFRVLGLSYVFAGEGDGPGTTVRRQTAFLSGFARGVNEMHSELSELSSFDERPSRALERYEAYHGFHKDLDILTVAERKKAAYADLADYFSGAFSFHNVMESFLEDDDRLDGFRLKDHIPYRQAFDLFIANRDFTHAWRLVSFFGFFGKREQAELLESARDEGIAFLNCRGLRIGPNVPRDGREVALCFSGDDTFAMPPLGDNSFLNVEDLSISGPEDLTAALNVDHVVMALEMAAERAVHDAARTRILNTAGAVRQRARERLRELGFDVPEGGILLYETMVARTGRVPAPPPAAKPRFWRAARILDAISSLGQPKP